MTKVIFVLFVWAGFGKDETMSIDHFDTMAECKAVKETIINEYRNGAWKDYLGKSMDCYKVEVKE